MEILTNLVGRHDELVELFTATFTASEGAEEGAVVGQLARDLLAQTPAEDLRVAAAEDGGALIGCGIFSRVRYARDPQLVFILSPMAVATAHQGQGVGQAVLNAALASLKAEGVDVALTYGDPRYYAKVGFRPAPATLVEPPYVLQHAHGWQAQALQADDFAPLTGPSRFVQSLMRPEYW